MLKGNSLVKTDFTSSFEIYSNSSSVGITQNARADTPTQDTMALIRFHIKESDKKSS